jgi:hypothetical protein
MQLYTPPQHDVSQIRIETHAHCDILPFLRIPSAGDTRHEALETVRHWLFAVFGCERTLEIFLQLADERMTYEELARSLGKNRAQVWRLVRQGWNEVRWAAIAEAAIIALERDGGFTIDPQTARVLPPADEDCFAVSLAGAGCVLPDPTVEDIRAYARAHAGQLLRQRRQRVYLGGWRPDRDSLCTVLDLTVVLDDEQAARDLGRRQGQDCIYNLRTGEEIALRRRTRIAA